MKNKNTPLNILTLAALFSMLLIRVASAESTNAWTNTNGISANIFWSTPPNWSRGAVPVPTDDIIFNDGGATLNGSVLSVNGGGTNVFTPANITSIIDGNRTVHWLYLCPTNTTGGWQNLYISNGVTLTVQGTEDNGMGPFGDFDNASGSATVSILNSLDTMYVGRKLGANVSTLQANPTLVSISGEGTLFLNNTNNQMQVRDANSSGGAHTAILDMSALANFNANIGRLKVGMGEQNSTNLRAAGSLFLARTNLLVLAGPIYTNFFVQPATNTGLAELDNLVVGLNPQNNGNASSMYLGWSNGIYADALLIGGRKSGGATFAFNPAFANPTYVNTQPTPTAVFRNSKGGPVVYFRVGDEIDGSAGTAGSGTMDLTGGIVDIVADNMIVGRAQPNTGAETAIMRLGDGTVNVNNVEFSSQGSALVKSAVTTTINLVGTQMTVTNSLKMVNGYLRTQLRTLNLVMGADANGKGATLTTLGNVTTGFIDTSLPQNSGINVTLTNSTFAMVNAQPFEASTLILDGGTISNASYMLITGNSNNVVANNVYGSAMTIINNGRILGSPILDLGVRTATPPTWDVSGVGGAIPGTLIVSNLLEGIGTVQGNVEQAPGATIQAGEGTTAGALTFAAGGLNSGAGNLILNTNGNLAFGLSPSGASGNDSIIVQGTLTLLGTNSVTLTALGGSFDTVNPYTLITTGGALPAGAANFFKASGALGGSRYILTFDTTTAPNNVLLHVSGSGAANDTWVGGQNGNAWDVKTTANWSGGQFFDLDNVTFNDSGSASPAVNTIGSIIPGLMTVATTNKNYGFGGTGSILVGGAFTTIGAGSVNFTNSGGVTFQDGLTIASNAVVLGSGAYSINGDPGTQVGLTLNGGSLTFAGNSTVTFLNPVFSQTLNVNSGNVSFVNSTANVFGGSLVNLVDPNSHLVFGQPGGVSATCDAAIAGAGAVIQNGPGLIALTGANSFGNPAIINGGTLQAGSTTAFGGVGAIVNSGATLDVAGNSIVVPVSAGGSGVGGQGALISSSGTGGGLTGGLTLTTNVSVGGTPPWSFDPVQNSGLFVMSGILTASYTNAANTSTNGYNFTKVGANEVQYNFGTVDPMLANIDVQSGMLYLEGSGGLGNPTNTITVESGATLALAAFSDAINGVPTKKWILNGNGVAATLLDYSTTATIFAGPVTLNGACILGVAPDSRIASGGNSGIPGGAEIQGTISGAGSLSKPGDDTWTLDGTNTYTGNTTVGGGILKLQGGGSIAHSAQISIQNGASIDTTTRTDDQNLNLATGQTLTTFNNGYINGNLATAAGSTTAPGGPSSVDVLSVIGNVTLSGTTTMKLDPLLLTSDQLDATNGGNSIQYGGTLNLTDFEGSYAIGQMFTLFAASTLGGSFANVTPAQPGSGLAWDTSRLAIDGTIKIIAGVVTGPNTNASITKVSLASTNLIVHGTNNNVPNNSFHYVVLTTTNLLTPLNNWTPIATNPFNADGTFDYTNPIVPGTPRQFLDVKAVQ